MKGSLNERNVSDLVVQIFTAKRSGILRLSQGEVKKSLYFKDGSIVFAHSNLKHERLGEILLRLGKITEQEFQSVEGKLKGGTRLGQALHDQGFISPAEVNSGVSYQIQMIVYSVFNWVSGEYEFVDRVRPVFEDIMVEGSTSQLLIDGIRNITNLDLLDRSIRELEKEVVSVSSGTRRLKRTNLDFSEETILACINGKATVAQLRSITRLSAIEFNRALYCLSISGMVRFGGVDKMESSVRDQDQKPWQGSPLETQPMSHHESARAARRRMKTYSEAELRKLIAETEIRFRDASDEEVLNVFPDSLPEEIQLAYDRLTEVFHPPYYAVDRYNDVKASLKVIVDRLHEAHHNLMERAEVQQPFMEEDLHRPAMVTPLPLPPQQPVVEIKDLSVDQLREALNREPVNTRYMRDLGLKLQQGGRAREGEKHLLRALEVEPRNVDNHFALADFYQIQGMKFKAFRHLNVVLQLDPENQKAKDALGIKKRKGGLYEISN